MKTEGPVSARRGSNLPRVSDYNQVVMLDAIRRSGAGLSRVELSTLTGLSAQTVSNICRRLMAEELVVEAGKRSAGPGKPRTILRLAPSGRYALGVHLDPAVMTFVILDLYGSVVASSRRGTSAVIDPDSVIKEMGAEIQALIDGSGIERNRFVGLGVATPGPVVSTTGEVMNPPNLMGWHHVRLRDALQEISGFPVLLDKDVIAAAVAELWAGGGNGTGSFIFVYLGTGVGAGLVMDGEVIRGASGNAGEIGHLITDPDGLACTCGLRGCLGMAYTPWILVKEAMDNGLGSWPLDDARAVDAAFTEVTRLAADGRSEAVALIDRSAERVGKSVADIANLLDLDRVVFGGPLWTRLQDSYLRIVPRVVERYSATASIHGVEVVGTRVGADVGAIGAACLVLDHTFSPRAATLMLQP